MQIAILPLAPILVAANPAVTADTVPAAISAMLNAALATGSDADVATIAKYAATSAPESAAAIAALVDAWRVSRAKPLLVTPTVGNMAGAESVTGIWSGRAELSGFASTGNTRNIGVAGAVELQRETARWRHKVHGAAEYQESLGVASREHYLAAYEPNFKFAPRGYVYGAAQYEADRFLGYTDRYSASLGAGYNAVKRPGLTLDVELGPAFRHTNFTNATTERNLAARGSLDFDWKLSKAVSVSQDASAYVQRLNSTVTGRTALNAKLIGPLAASFSYTVQYESQPPIGRVTTDTTSRAGLVYSF